MCFFKQKTAYVMRISDWSADVCSSDLEGPLMDRYMAVLRWTLINRWKMIGLGVLSFIMTIVLFATLPQTFPPSIDVDYSAVKIELPPGTRLDDTILAADKAAPLLSKHPEVEAVAADVRKGGQEI